MATYRIYGPNYDDSTWETTINIPGSGELGYKYQLQMWSGSAWVDAPFNSIKNAGCRFEWWLVNNQVPETKMCENWVAPNTCTNPYNSNPTSHILTPTSGTSAFVVVSAGASDTWRPQIGVHVDACNDGRWDDEHPGTNLTVSYINLAPPIATGFGPTSPPSEFCRVYIQGPPVLNCNELGTYGPTQWNQNDGYLYSVSDHSWTLVTGKNSSSVGLLPPSASYLFSHPESRTVRITVTRVGSNCIESSSSMWVTANCGFINGVRDWPAIFRKNPSIQFRPSPLNRF